MLEARRAFLVDTLQKLLGQDSPTGYTEKVVTVAEGIARELGFATRRTNKGNLVITVPGRETGRKVGLCAHVDTLGLMVRSVTADGVDGHANFYGSDGINQISLKTTYKLRIKKFEMPLFAHAMWNPDLRDGYLQMGVNLFAF